MKEFKFVPKVCKEAEGAPAAFSGHIMLEIPKFDDRYKMIEESGFEVDESGEVKQIFKKLAPIVRVAAAAGKLVREVAIAKKANEESGEGEVRYANFDELQSDPDCDAIMLELGQFVMNGFRVSKN